MTIDGNQAMCKGGWAAAYHKLLVPSSPPKNQGTAQTPSTICINCQRIVPSAISCSP